MTVHPKADTREGVRVMTLNLHGYHPMGEPSRWQEDRDGNLRRTGPALFFFTTDELYRGNLRRLDVLAEDVRRLQPDFLLLQEVAAGDPDHPKNSAVFEAHPELDSSDKNTALRLNDRLADAGYAVALACRGNAGWITDSTTFRERRIMTIADGERRVIWDFEENPYPDALLVEGYAILYRKDWQLRSNATWRLVCNEEGHEFTFQVASFEEGDTASGQSYDSKRPWILVVNVHGGHGLCHFEEAVAVRTALTEYIVRHPDRAMFRGLIVGGDFNAPLYRPAISSDQVASPLSVPWEVTVPGQYDYHVGQECGPDFESLERSISEFLAQRAAFGLTDETNTAQRMVTACNRFGEWQRNAIANGLEPVLRESLTEANRTGVCTPDSRFAHAASEMEWRIDHIFADTHFKTSNAYVLYADCYRRPLDTVSDHPAIVADLEWCADKVKPDERTENERNP